MEILSVSSKIPCISDFFLLSINFERCFKHTGPFKLSQANTFFRKILILMLKRYLKIDFFFRFFYFLTCGKNELFFFEVLYLKKKQLIYVNSLICKSGGRYVCCTLEDLRGILKLGHGSSR